MDPGNLIRANDANGLLVITQLQPITVVFTIPEDSLPAVLEKLKTGEQLTVEAFDREQKKKLATGTLLTVDNQIDPNTGTVRLKAVFPNDDNELFPNQFVNARLLLDVKRGTTVVPSAAVQRGPKGTFVYVVNADRTVAVRPVTVGVSQGEDASIDTGLSPDELVVVDGTEKLREGSKVDIRNQSGEPSTGTAPAAERSRYATERDAVVNPSRLFILRPVATALSMVAVLLAGFIAYRQLPVSALPQVDYPTIQVLTFYPGASPDVMASSVTAPLERQFGQMPGLNQMTSTSSGGSSIITLQFSLELDLDVAEQEVQAAINGASTFLPRDLPSPPVYSKVNPADAPILTLALTSRTLPLPQVEDLAETRFAQKISQLSGVGLVSISGGQRPAVRIQANPRALSAYGLTLEDLRVVVAAANVNQAKGAFDGPKRASIISATDQLLTSKEYQPLIVTYRNGAPVHLSDVADVIDDVENVKQAAWMNEVPAVIVNIQRQPGANVIDVVDRIKKLLPQLQSALPSSVQVTVLTDRTISIRASVRDVQFELMLAVALVIMVIFLFLRTLSSTVIPAAAVPLSLVGTFGVMYLLGFSLNNLTLMALTISTGFVVDDAIVMIENIARYIEKGDSPLEAALQGIEADRLHHPLPDRLADRRADSAPVHGRRGGPLVPRVCHHPQRHDPHLGRRFADADADDVRQAASPRHEGGAGLVLPRLPRAVRPDHRGLRQDACDGC